MEDRVIHSPDIPEESGAPDACDDIHFLRFRPRDGSTLDPINPQGVNPASTDAMLVMLPGILEGANGFEYMARQLVYLAKIEDHRNIECWAVERRNNRLEDLNAANYLEDQVASGAMNIEQAAQVAIDYYYGGKPLNGKTFGGWYRDKDVPFLSEFGLELDTKDVFTVMNTMVPDQATRKQKVFVGGHSLGGIMTSMFAAWDLDGNPATLDDAGFNNCAGIFGLDTIVTPINEIVDLYAGILPKGIYDMVSNMTEGTYAQFVAGMRSGQIPVILPFPLITVESMGLLEALSIAAYYEPDTECTLIHKIPYSHDVEALLGFLHSYDLSTFMTNKPEVRDFRYTNEAVLGAVFDDSFTPVSMIQASMGFLKGGPVVKKSFPAYDVLYAIPGVSQIVSNIMGKGPYYIPNDAGPINNLGKGPLYSWVNFDEVGDADDPNFQDTAGQTTYTTTTNEVADISDVARALHRGPTNLTEWYFSMRLIVDLVGGSMSFGPKYGLNVLHANRVKELPKIEFVAEQGVLNDTIMGVLVPYKYKFIKGYNHLDVLMASANTSSRRPNEVIRPLINFVLQKP
jgi:pimeloyl-ACP methyl ester carboxylesterase